MKFEDRYALNEIRVGEFVLKQLSTSAWGNAYKHKMFGKYFPVFVIFSEERNKWTVLLDYSKPDAASTCYEMCEFHNRNLEDAITMAKYVLAAMPLTKGEPCQ